MPRKSILEDPQVREFIVAEVEGGGNLDTAGAKLDPPMTRQAISKWCRNNPKRGGDDLRTRIDAIRLRQEAGEWALQARERHQDRPGRAMVRPGQDRAPPTQEAAAEVLGVPVALVRDADRAPGPNVPELIEWAWEVVRNDPNSRVAPECARALFGYKLGPLIRAQQMAEEREAARLAATETVSQDDGAAIIELPVNDTEAPGRAPRPVETGVLEAEVVDRG
jgi:hypothetical protein